MTSKAITTRRRLGVAFIGEAERRYLKDASGTMPFDLTLRENQDSHLPSGALLIFGMNGELEFAARVTRRRRVDGLRTAVTFDELINTRPLQVEQLRATLLSSQRSPAEDPGGTFTDKASERVTEWLERHDSDLADKIARWRSHATVRPPGASATIYEQRDATVTLFRMANMRNALTDTKDPTWQVKAMQKTYLPGRPLEDSAIVADACSFLGWQQEVVDGWGASAFSDGVGSTLTIANINRLSSETATGADLVYYHVQRRSFVHVQYKRMHRVENPKLGQAWVYDEDRHFAQQLDSLLVLNRELEQYAAASKEFRLSPETGYFKFTKMDDYSQGDAALVPGQYMGASLLDLARQERGGGLGRLRTDHGLPYLTNTLFADLVGYGLVGSRGANHVDVAKLIGTLAQDKESVVLGIHSEDKPTRRVRERDAVPMGGRVDLGPLVNALAQSP